MIIKYFNSIDEIISVSEPILDQVIDTSDVTKWQSEGIDISLMEDYIEETDLSQYPNPRRGYLVADTVLLKPFLVAQGVDISKIEEFEEA